MTLNAFKKRNLKIKIVSVYIKEKKKVQQNNPKQKVGIKQKATTTNI